MVYILSQVFGGLGVLSNFLAFQQKNHGRMLIVKLIADTLWATHYFLLNAYTGVATSVILVIGWITFFVFEKKERTAPKMFPALLIVATIVSSVLTWQTWHSALPMVGMSLIIASFWQRNPKITYAFQYCISLLLLAYHLLFTYSVAGMLSEIMQLCSVTIAIVRTVNKNKCV